MKNNYYMIPLVYNGQCTDYYIINTNDEIEVYDSKRKLILPKDDKNNVVLVIADVPWNILFEV